MKSRQSFDGRSRKAYSVPGRFDGPGKRTGRPGLGDGLMDISGIDFLGIDRVLRRGSGEILEERDDAILVRDSVSGACFLGCEDAAAGMPLLERLIGQDCDLLMVSDYALGTAAFERFGFSEKLECYQVAYYGEKPAAGGELTFRAADEHDLALLTENYRRISPEELERVVERKTVLLGFFRDRLVGFVGEHLEGSMGLLYVFEEYRRRGFGAALQRQLIAKTLEEGYIPFGQVEGGNLASLRLQRKIGMTQSENRIVWMWK